MKLQSCEGLEFICIKNQQQKVSIFFFWVETRFVV